MSRRPALFAAIIRPVGMQATTELIESTIAIGYGARDLGAAYDKYSILRALVSGQPGFEAALIDVLGKRTLRATGSPVPEVEQYDRHPSGDLIDTFSPVEFDPAIEVTAAEVAEVDPELTMVRMEPLPATDAVLKLSEPMVRALENLDDAKPNTVKALESRGLVERVPDGKGFKAKLSAFGRRITFRRSAK